MYRLPNKQSSDDFKHDRSNPTHYLIFNDYIKIYDYLNPNKQKSHQTQISLILKSIGKKQ